MLASRCCHARDDSRLEGMSRLVDHVSITNRSIMGIHYPMIHVSNEAEIPTNLVTSFTNIMSSELTCAKFKNINYTLK